MPVRAVLVFLTGTVLPQVTIKQMPDVLVLDRMDIPGAFKRSPDRISNEMTSASTTWPEDPSPGADIRQRRVLPPQFCVRKQAGRVNSEDQISWACDRLLRFIDASERQHNHPPPGVISGGDYGPKASEDEVLRQWAVVERVLQHYLPDWESRLAPGDGYKYTGYRWGGRREGAALCLAALEAEAEIREHLEPIGPTLRAQALHPWVWDSARSLWNSQHHREAVEAAAKGLNAYTQQKTGMSLAEGDLFVQAFSDDPPKPDRPRLRPVGGGDDSLSAKSLRRGIRDFASGCYAAIRNPKAHDDPTSDTPEAEALEQLAALSVLARWVDGASLVKV